MSANQFSNPAWLKDNGFRALSEIAWLLDHREKEGRDALIRVLEFRDSLSSYEDVLAGLIQRAGLFPYLTSTDGLSIRELINYEFHRVPGMEGVVLHSIQARVYRALIDGTNVILSAPTSFGKSLLIDAMIASGDFSCVVVIVPTIALIDETRRRLTKRFSADFKIITHPSQQPGEHSIYILTQERYVEFEKLPAPDFFVLDEFYKLSPTRGDERTFVLNQAFYELLRSGAQFFLIGPNIQDITINESSLNFRYFRTDFATVATEIIYRNSGSPRDDALEICKTVGDPTLIFCKSPRSAIDLAEQLIAGGVSAPHPNLGPMVDWLSRHYHPKWNLPELLKSGIAIHHAGLPRSIGYHVLRKFNEGAIRYLLCTSTIIEGVNTCAKNIIIYDNKIANEKLDQFTFNNIKGRAGRMLKHFVGHVYVLNQEPEPELPIVDIPSITQPDTAPESLLIQLNERDLSEHSAEKLRYLHAQDTLPIAVIRSNRGFDPLAQLNLAASISASAATFHPHLSWTGFPQSPQLRTACELIFKHLMGDKPKDGILSAAQLHYKITQLLRLKSIKAVIVEEFNNERNDYTISEAIEATHTFLRRWAEFHFPRYISALDKIQRSVFERKGLTPGDYSTFGTTIKHLFMPPAATILEEYGVPYQVTLRLGPLGNTVDEIVRAIKEGRIDTSTLTPFEQEMLKDVVANM